MEAKFNMFVYLLALELKYESLTLKILNKSMFKELMSIQVFGVINNIQADLFKYFGKIKSVDLLIDNLKDLFHRGNKWMMYLNNHVQVNLSNQTEIKSKISSSLNIRFLYKAQKSFITQIYEYPDEDFCLFQYFPHDHLVLPLLVPGKKIECSCTVLWLVQYYTLYFKINNQQGYVDSHNDSIYYDVYLSHFKYTIKYCHDTHFKENFFKCNFSQRLANCRSSNFKINDDNDYSQFKVDNDTDLLYFIKWLQFILLIVLQPILSFFGVFNNFLTIMVIRAKSTKKRFKDNMYKHIVINSTFNIIYCILMVLKLNNQCLFYNSDVFCSSVYQFKSMQYFKIIIVSYLGNVVKLCKNISFVLFTYSRFILSLNKTGGFYEMVNKMNIKSYIINVVLFALLFNIYKLFQFDVVSNYDPTTDFHREIYNKMYC